MAKTVGVRQLRNETSRIVRDVREGHAEYVITVSGEPAARLVPVEERKRRIQEFLEEMDRLAVDQSERIARVHGLKGCDAI